MKELYFDVHGVSIKLQSTHKEFSEFVKENYAVFSINHIEQPDINITFAPRTMEWTSQASSNHSHLGNNVYISERSILWKNEFGFRVLVEHRPPQIEVFAYHKELIEEQKKSERYKNYQRCMRWAIHYPLFTNLQYKVGWELLHGAAVSNGKQTVAFCGLNNMGKSTLATHLCRKRGYDLVTDNYLLYGGNQIYAFPEVLRLGERSVNRYDLTPIWNHKIYDKYHISPTDLGVQMKTTPDVFFILSRGDQLRTRAIEPKNAWQTMDNLHSMLGEFPEHNYMTAWPLVSGLVRESIDEHDSLYQTPWYSLAYEPDWDIEAVIQEVNQCI